MLRIVGKSSSRHLFSAINCNTVSAHSNLKLNLCAASKCSICMKRDTTPGLTLLLVGTKLSSSYYLYLATWPCVTVWWDQVTWLSLVISA